MTDTSVLASEAVDEAAQAQQAREAAAARLGKPRAPDEVPRAEPRAPKEGEENYFEQFRALPREPTLSERARLNAINGYYRGTLAGSSRLVAMSHEASQPDDPKLDPEMKKARDRTRAEYADIISDLARYDGIRSWGTSTEGAVAFAGTLGGSMLSPESWIGAGGSQSASWLGRTAYAALTQAAISAGVDPIVQALNMQAGVQQNYDPIRTILAGTMGAVIGGGLHLSGELIGSAALKLTKHNNAREDPQFAVGESLNEQQVGEQAAREQLGALSPEQREAAVSPPKIEPTEEATPEQETIAHRLAQGEEYTPPEIAPPVEEPKAAAAAEAKTEAVSAPATEEPAVEVKARKPRQVVESKLSILPFLANRGGLRPDPELDVLFGGKNPFIPGFGRLIRKNGMSLDRAREASVEGKFMFDTEAEESSINRLLELIDEEARGRKQYSAGHEPVEKAEERGKRLHEIESRFDAEMGEQNVAPQIRKRALEIMDKEGVNDPAAAYEKATLERADMENADARREATGDIFGWDVDERGTAFEGGGEVSTEAPGAGEGVRPSGTTSEATPAGEQIVLPGGEQSARQLAAAREASGHGRIRTDIPQAEPGPLLAPGETEADLLFTQQRGAQVRNNTQQLIAQKDQAIRSVQQQAMDLSEKLDIPLRAGRVQQGAAGQFSTKSGVARVREIGDFLTVVHELGHGLESKIGMELTHLTWAHDRELSSLVPDPTGMDTPVRIKEGFAEFMRSFFESPAWLARNAPQFSIEFKNFMEANHPDIWNTLSQAAKDFEAYRSAQSPDAIHAVIRSRKEDPKGFAAIVDQLRNEKFSTNVKNMFLGWYAKTMDNKAPMTELVRTLGRFAKEKTGQLVDLKAAYNPVVLLRALNRALQSGGEDVRQGVRPWRSDQPSTPSLPDALAKATGKPTVWGKWDEGPASLFMDYLVARMGDVRWRQFHNGDLQFEPVPFSHNDALVAIREIEAAQPTFREAADMVDQWSKGLLKKRYEAGIIPKELYDQLSLAEFYVPLYRDMGERALERPPGGGVSGLSNTIQRFQGSRRDILQPFESLMHQAFLVARKVAHNEIMNSLEDLSKMAGIEGGRFFEVVPARQARKYTFEAQESIKREALRRGLDPTETEDLVSMITDLFGEDPVIGSMFKMEPTSPRGEPIVFYHREGQLRAARVINEKEGLPIYEALSTMPKQVGDLFSNMIALGGTALRAGITLNPTYMLSNYLRDQFATAILYRGYVPIYSGMSGVRAELSQGEIASLYAYSGGIAGGAATGAINRMAEDGIDALARQGYSITRVPHWKELMEAATISEQGTRLSIFKNVYEAKLKEGLSGYEAMWEAASQARDILDFDRHGSHTLAIIRMLPFLNAHMQGLGKAERTLIHPFIESLKGQVFTGDKEALSNAWAAWIKFAGVGTALGAFYAAINYEKESYRDAAPFLKGTHLVVPFGEKVLVIPKPFELGLGFTMGEYAYGLLAKQDPRAMGQFAQASWAALAPPNPLTDLPLVKTWYQLMTNKSTFSGRDIVPQNLQGRDEAEQYTEKTSSLAKHIGKLINVSPMKIDFAIGDVFGTWGRDAMQLSSAIDEDAPAQNWADRVFFRRFIKDPARTSDVTTQYWNFMRRDTGRYNRDVNTYDGFVKDQRFSDARSYLAKLPASEKAFVILRSAADEDNKPVFNAKEKRLHPYQRAYDALSATNGLRHEIANNAVLSVEAQEKIPLTPIQRRDLLDSIRELGQAEMRNSLVIMKEPGYQGRPLVELDPIMEKIRRTSPAIAQEVANRYAINGVYTTKAVAGLWPQVRDELIRNGSQADVGGMAFDAEGDGYEFGADRLRKPAKRRIMIEPGVGLGR